MKNDLRNTFFNSRLEDFSIFLLKKCHMVINLI